MINIQENQVIIGIYKITSPSGRVYIGQAIDIHGRFESYSKLQNCKNQIRLYNSIKKYSWGLHKKEILESCLINQLNEQERYWQDYYDVLGLKGLNCKLTKTNSKSGKLSDKTCEKKSKSMKGKYIRLGVILSDDIKDKMSKASLGKPKPWLKGRIRSESELNKARKPIIQYDLEGNFIQGWNSITEAALFLNFKKGNISANCRGKIKSYKGFIWKFKE